MSEKAKTSNEPTKGSNPQANQGNQPNQDNQVNQIPEVKTPKKVDSQIEVEIERKKFNADGEKISSPRTQYMNPKVLAHFLKNANAVGWTVTFKEVPETVTEEEKELINKSIKIWNKANGSTEKGKKGKRELELFK